MKYRFTYDSPIGKLTIHETDNALSHVRFSLDDELSDYVIKETSLIKKAFQQLAEYFNGTRTSFDLPLYIKGTPFQEKVWKALLTIPYGKTASYKDIGIKVNNPKGARAVGMANNKNNIAIIIPCHRIIGSNGKLVGYAGGLKIKQYLLNLEKTK